MVDLSHLSSHANHQCSLLARLATLPPSPSPLSLLHSLCFLVKHTPNLFLFFPFVPWTNPGCVCQEHTPPQRTGATCTWQSQKGCLPVLPSTQRGARSTQRPRRPLIPMSYPHNGGMRHTAPRGAPRKPTPFSSPAPCQPAPPLLAKLRPLCVPRHCHSHPTKMFFARPVM